MRVAITGATGFLGRHVLNHLLRKGMHPVALGRSATRLRTLGDIDTKPVDFDGPVRALASALEGCRAVIHLADDPDRTSADASSSSRLARSIALAAQEAGCERFVFASSIYASQHERGGEGENAYGQGKLAAEQALATMFKGDKAPPCVALRLPPVYGPGSKGSVAFLSAMIAKGVPLPFAKAKALRDYLYVGNLATLCGQLITCDPGAFADLAGHPHEPCDGAPVSTARLSRMIASAMDKRVVLLPFPRPILSALARVAGRQDQIDAAFSELLCRPADTLQSLAGWVPSSDMEANLSYLRKGRPAPSAF